MTPDWTKALEAIDKSIASVRTLAHTITRTVITRRFFLDMPELSDPDSTDREINLNDEDLELWTISGIGLRPNVWCRGGPPPPHGVGNFVTTSPRAATSHIYRSHERVSESRIRVAPNQNATESVPPDDIGGSAEETRAPGGASATQSSHRHVGL
jgi:hypothetical protein